MVLVVGGVGAGKRSFARERLGVAEDGFWEARRGADVPKGVRAVARAQELAWDSAPEDACVLLRDVPVVICDEVGCGVVPLDAGERAWRERAGRLGCLLAEEADAVVRVCCGIPQVIKGPL